VESGKTVQAACNNSSTGQQEGAHNGLCSRTAVDPAQPPHIELLYGRRLKRYPCRSCGHQATLTAGTIMQATKLPLTSWFLAFYLIGQAKTGISVRRQLGRRPPT
jgi:hypothetical protein